MAFGSTGLTPFDVDRDDLVGPDSHDASYGMAPQIVAVAGPDYVDVAIQSTTDQKVSILRVRRLEQTWGITRVAATPRSLGRLMGFARDAEGAFYYATGTADPDVTADFPVPKAHREDVVRVFKLDGTGKALFDVDLDTARGSMSVDSESIIRPMVASSARLTVLGDRVSLVHGINTEPDGNGTRHQKALTTMLNSATGAVGALSGSWVSHSFDQRTLTDADAIFEMHLGDAYPRGVLISRRPAVGEASELLAYAFKGATGDNHTRGRLGSVVPLGGGKYLAAFVTERESATIGERVQGTRELALARFAVSGDSMSVDESFGESQAVESGGENKTNHVLFVTNNAAIAAKQRHVERPRLIPTGDGAFLALYEQWSVSDFLGTYAMRLDANGNVAKAETKVSDGHLPRGDDAFPLLGGAAWITGDKEAHTLTLHRLDAELIADETVLR